MNNENGNKQDNTPQSDPFESLSQAIHAPISRRDFLKVGGVGALGILIPQLLGLEIVAASPAAGTSNPFPANAKGMVIGIPSRCTGCNRCEIACTSFNDGKVSPATARIKVSRNINFGPKGAQEGYWHGEGQFGNFLEIQDTCRQCGHPVPCQLACPVGAIEVIDPVNARVVNQDKCTGCRICQAACHWGMTSFDEALKKATKCHLCNGSPECVKACPTGALQYVPWQDKTKDVPVRWVVPASITMPADVAATCGTCHK
jgi:Fe-S-cluster-containing dehydrogenase component